MYTLVHCMQYSPVSCSLLTKFNADRTSTAIFYQQNTFPWYVLHPFSTVSICKPLIHKLQMIFTEANNDMSCLGGYLIFYKNLP